MPPRAVVVFLDDSDDELGNPSPSRSSAWPRAAAPPPNSARPNVLTTTSPAPAKGTNQGNKAWVVFAGRVPGVYQTWDGAAAQLQGCPNIYRAYRTLQEAEQAWADRYMEPHSPSVSATPPRRRAAAPIGAPFRAATNPSAHALARDAIPKAAAAAPRSPAQTAQTAMQPSPSLTRGPCTPSLIRHTPHAAGAARTEGKANGPVSGPHLRAASPTSLLRLLSIDGDPDPFAEEDDGLYYAVLQGVAPGVYLGSTLSNRALGYRGTRHAIQVDTLREAQRVFCAWMSAQDGSGGA